MSAETKVLQDILKMSKETLEAVAALAGIPISVVNEAVNLKNSSMASHLLSGLNTVETRACQEFALEDIKKALVSEKIPFVVTFDEKNQFFIQTRKSDSERVEALADHIMATKSRKIEFTPKEFKRMFSAEYSYDHAKRKSVTFSYITPDQFAIVKQQAYRDGITMCRTLNGDGTYELTVLSKDKSNVESILRDANISLSGISGDVLKAKMQDSEKEIETAAGRVYDIDHDFYVVSANNPKRYLHVYTDKETGARVCDSYMGKKGHCIMYEQEAVSGTKVFNELGSFSKPVIIEADEFIPDPQARKEYINNKLKEKSTKLKLSKEQKQTLNKEFVFKDLIKIRQSYDEQYNHSFNPLSVVDKESTLAFAEQALNSPLMSEQNKENLTKAIEEYKNFTQEDISNFEQVLLTAEKETEQIIVSNEEVIEYDETIDIDEIDEVFEETIDTETPQKETGTKEANENREI